MRRGYSVIPIGRPRLSCCQSLSYARMTCVPHQLPVHVIRKLSLLHAAQVEWLRPYTDETIRYVHLLQTGGSSHCMQLKRCLLLQIFETHSLAKLHLVLAAPCGTRLLAGVFSTVTLTALGLLWVLLPSLDTNRTCNEEKLDGSQGCHPAFHHFF